MTRSEIRRTLYCMERDGKIDRWKEEYYKDGCARFYVQADNKDEWHLYYDETDW